MRAKRSKKYRKLMHQYALTFGFREPYQVLVDSHFLRALYAYKMDLLPSLERTLHGTVKPLISKCSLAALLSSSSQNASTNSAYRPPSLPPPTTLPLRHCSHNATSTPISETSCLLELLGGASERPAGRKNKEHYILASADPQQPATDGPSQERGPDLRTQARDIPGVPIIYVKRSVMVLEEMSGRSERTKTGLEREKYLAGEGARKTKRKRGEEEDDAEEEQQQQSKDRGAKRAKGPNPLSVMKAKKTQTTTGTEGGEEMKPKRKRRHKKAAGGAGDVAGGGQVEVTS